MRCPVCGQAPPRGANFCFACGASLARVCPRCQAGQSPEARFCPECGTRLAARPGDASEPPDEAATAAAQPLPDLLPGGRERTSRWRVAGLVGGFLLVLFGLAAAALWLGAGQRPVARAPAAAAPVVAPAPVAPTPEPPAAPPAPLAVAAPAPPPSGGPAAGEAARPEPPQTTAAPLAAPPELPPRARAPVDFPAASPRGPRAGSEASGVRIEVATERHPGGVTEYRVRLRARDGAPVRGAAVSVRGRRADGVLVEVALDPAPEPGVYEAALRLAGITDPRLRVARAGVVEDVPLPE